MAKTTTILYQYVLISNLLRVLVLSVTSMVHRIMRLLRHFSFQTVPSYATAPKTNSNCCRSIHKHRRYNDTSRWSTKHNDHIKCTRC